MKTGRLALVSRSATRRGDERAAWRAASAVRPTEATLFRVFLLDGSSLVSYGEPARLDDRVIFSMPTSASKTEPQLHLVNLSSSRVDWDERRGTPRRLGPRVTSSTQAETHYAQLTYEIAQALNDVATTDDTARRLGHRGTRAAHARSLAGALTTTTSGTKSTRCSASSTRPSRTCERPRASSNFDLTFVATAEAPTIPSRCCRCPRRRKRSSRRSLAAYLADQPDERMSLLTMALAGFERDASVLPTDWLDYTRREVQATLAAEVEVDRQVPLPHVARDGPGGQRRARAADVRGVERLVAEVRARDRELGGPSSDPASTRCSRSWTSNSTPPGGFGWRVTVGRSGAEDFNKYPHVDHPTARPFGAPQGGARGRPRARRLRASRARSCSRRPQPRS